MIQHYFDRRSVARTNICGGGGLLSFKSRQGLRASALSTSPITGLDFTLTDGQPLTWDNFQTERVCRLIGGREN